MVYAKGLNRPDVQDILQACLVAAVQLYVKEGTLWRALKLQAGIDPDAATLTGHENHDRIGEMYHLARLLEQQGYVRADVTVTEVGHILALLTDFVVYDQLTLTMGFTADQLRAGAAHHAVLHAA